MHTENANTHTNASFWNCKLFITPAQKGVLHVKRIQLVIKPFLYFLCWKQEDHVENSFTPVSFFFLFWPWLRETKCFQTHWGCQMWWSPSILPIKSFFTLSQSFLFIGLLCRGCNFFGCEKCRELQGSYLKSML